MNHNTPPGYRPEIDGLRAIAVLAVVLYHAGCGPATGFAGVDVFFVISGYLITLLLLRENAASGRIDLLGFYARRARRILPAAGVVVLATLYFSWQTLSVEEQGKIFRSAASAMAFCANFYFLQNSGGYFDGPSEDMPLLHLWSLSVEEQFYLIWPLLLMLAARFYPRHLKAGFAILALGSILLAEYWLRDNAGAAYFLMPARFWELAIGGLVAASSNRWGKGAAEYIGLLGLGAIAAGLLIPMPHFPGIGALPVVAGAAMVLSSLHGSGKPGVAGALLGFAPLAYVGRLSYSLYLWHWPLLAIYRASHVDTTKADCLMLCGAAFMLAALSHRYVEAPFRTTAATGHIGAKTRAKAGTVVGFSAAMLLVTTAAILAFNHIVVRAGQAGADAPDYATSVEQDRTLFGPGCKLGAVDLPDRFPPAGCESLRGVKPTIAVWGDSFATAWQPLAWAIAKKSGLSAADYTRDMCPPFLSDFADRSKYREGVCSDFNRNVVGKIRGFDTVILAARWENRPLAMDEEGMRATLRIVSPMVRRVIVIGPSPTMHKFVAKCIRASSPESCTVSRKEFETESDPMRGYLKMLAAQYKNVEFVELEDFLCTAANCPPVKDGVALYFDDIHVTHSAARKFAAEYVAPADLPPYVAPGTMPR